jgi:ADP-ribose pyrophosphatase
MKFASRGFETSHEETVHSWAMFRLVRRIVRSPKNEQFERTFVHTPGAVATVAVLDSGEIVLVEQYRATFGGYVLEIPAGMRDVADEPPEVTARRELIEEAGCDAASLEFLGECLSSPGVTDSSVLVYLATEISEVPMAPHGPEEDEMVIRRVKFADAVAMIEDGRIADAKSAYGILLAARRRPDLVQ